MLSSLSNQTSTSNNSTFNLKFVIAVHKRRVIFSLWIVSEAREPVGWVCIIIDLAKWASSVIFNHHHNVLLLQVVLQSLDHRLRFAVELGPNLDSKCVFAARSTLIEQPDPWEHVSPVEDIRDDAENQLLPDRLQEGQVRPEVDSELATIFIDRVLPFRLNSTLKQTQTVDANREAFDLDTIDAKRRHIWLEKERDGISRTYIFTVRESELKKMFVRSRCGIVFHATLKLTMSLNQHALHMLCA